LAEREEAQKREAEARESEAEAQKREAEQAKRVARRTLAGLAAAIVLALVASGFAIFAYQQRGAALQATEAAKVGRNSALKAEYDAHIAAEETQRQLDRANRALAESINNDLGLELNVYLSARQRQTLWKLAVADEAVKSDYVALVALLGVALALAARFFASRLRPARPSTLAPLSADGSPDASAAFAIFGVLNFGSEATHSSNDAAVIRVSRPTLTPTSSPLFSQS
jgi:hypothetical protein